MRPAGRGTSRAGLLPWGGLWRQTRRDLAPMVVGLVIIAAAAFLASVLPKALDSVVTTVVQDAVLHSSQSPEIVVNVPMDSYSVPDSDSAGSSEWIGGRIEAGMPAELRSVLAAPVTTLVGRELKAGSIAGRPGRVRLIYVNSAAGPALTWIEGRSPAATGDPSDLFAVDGKPLPVEVALSQAAAELIGIHAGDRLVVTNAHGESPEVRVSGVYRADNPADDAWQVAPTLLKPQLVDGSEAVAEIGLLVSAQSLPFAEANSMGDGMTRSYTYPVVASRLDASNAEQLATQARALATGRKTFDLGGVQPVIHTGFDVIVDAALARVAAASAQAAVLILGLLAAALLVELLVAGLLVERRSAVILQWRARGASLPAIALANLAEAALLTVVAGGLGVAVAAVVTGGVPSLGWALLILLAAVFPQPLLAVRAAAGTVGAVREPIGRRGPLSAAKARRVAAEILLALFAVAALVTLVARGVIASGSARWSDAVVLAAPVLVAVAVALGLVRLQPRALVMARSLAARRIGAVPLLAAARVRGSGLATATLVVACAVAAIATTVAATVSGGQFAAAWDAVGAEAMVTTNAPEGLPAAVTKLDGDAGLTLVTAEVVPSAQLLGTGIDRSVTVVAVDSEAFGRLLAQTSSANTSLKLLTTSNPRALPVLVTGLPSWDSATLRWSDDRLTVHSVGTAPNLPSQLGLADHPTVLADRRMLGQALGHEVAASYAWIIGPNAVPRLEQALVGSDAKLVTREGWLAAQVNAPLPRALGWLFAGAAGIAAVLAGLGVVLMAASGAWQRTRGAAQLRVVGMAGAAARRVSWLEAVVPAVLASLAGLAVGIGLSGPLVVALDLKSVTGGRQSPQLVITWWSLALPLVLGVIARVAVTAVGLGSRHEPLGPLMRAG